jgi:hypothetical protein
MARERIGYTGDFPVVANRPVEGDGATPVRDDRPGPG